MKLCGQGTRKKAKKNENAKTKATPDQQGRPQTYK